MFGRLSLALAIGALTFAASPAIAQPAHSCPTDRAMARTVHDLLARLGTVSDPEQQGVFDSLIALGPAAIPAIAAQMDDRRPLRTRWIVLQNHAADAFESHRQYGPALVVDALDAILDQITGAGLSSIYNGGTDRERTDAVARWRFYAAELPCRR